ncbi:hypothetical protein QTN47_11765 [Danxiaibacter flavus]|uniref:Lipoprotein n=1 Tax=Danxiaibacter flavus TaxID=3049108 RepID=A0ABV3ZEA5_9BACT|nr:hypothetical protein QNM32_11770 [Chitinophagaceae bacterium DXS]
MKRINLLVFICLLILIIYIAGCKGLSGTYVAKGDAFLEKIAFTSKNGVEISAMGITQSGTFKKDGDKVTISIAGENHVFTIDKDGCLDGGGLIGKYCKE